MNGKQFEKNLKDKFEEFSPRYKAKEEMWNTIASELPAKKDSRRGLFLFILLFCMAGMAFCYWNFFDRHEGERSVNETLMEYAGADLKRCINELAYDKIATLEGGENMQYQTTLMKKTDKTLIEKAIRPTESYVKTIHDSEHSNSIRANRLAFAILNSKVLRSNDLPSNLLGVKSPKSHAINSFQESASNSIAKEETIDITRLYQVSLLPLQVSMKNLILPTDNLPVIRSKDTQTLKAISESDKLRRFSAGLAMGIYSLRSAYKLNDTNYNSVIKQRADAEKVDYQYTFGLQFAYDVSPKWSIQSGVNFYHFQDESFRLLNNSQIDTIENYSVVEKTTSGADTTIMGTAFITNSSSTKAWNYTNRQLINIPIIITYNALLSEKSSMGIGLGLEKTIFTRIQGFEEDLNGTTYDLTLDNESRYGNNGAYALLQLMYKYKLSNKWDLRLESNYKHALSSNYKTTAPIEKSFNAFGISVSTHLKF